MRAWCYDQRLVSWSGTVGFVIDCGREDKDSGTVEQEWKTSRRLDVSILELVDGQKLQVGKVKITRTRQSRCQRSRQGRWGGGANRDGRG